MIRFVQFRLGAMLIAMTVVCICLAFWQSSIAPFREQKAGIAELTKLGATIQTRPANPYWMEKFVGEEDFVRVESVDLTYKLIKNEDLALIRKIPGLKELRLQGCPITNDGLAQLRGIEKLERLTISNTTLTGEALRHVAAIPSLKSLDIRNTPITDEDLVSITRLFDLEELYVSHPISEKALPTIAKLPRLKRLFAKGTNIRPEMIPQLAGCQLETPPTLSRGYRNRDIPHLVKLPSLKLLDLQMWPTDDELAQIATLTQLTDLRFHGHQATIAGLEHLTALPRLRSLRVNGTKFGEAEVRMLAEDFELNSLQFDSSRLTPATLMLLKQSRSLKELRVTSPWLDPAFVRFANQEFSRLDKCDIKSNAQWSYNDRGEAIQFISYRTPFLTDLSPLTDHPAMESISIRGSSNNWKLNKRPFAPLTGLKKLRFLEVLNSQVKSESLIDLVEMRNIEVLTLDNNRLDDDALKYIVQMPKLRHLSLQYSQITNAGFALLSQAESLETIAISSPKLTDDCWKYLHEMPQLQRAQLTKQHIHRFSTAGQPQGFSTAVVLRTIAELPGVEIVLNNPRIDYNGEREVVGATIYGAAFTEFEELVALKTLERVSIQFDVYNNPQKKAISDAAKLSALSKLPKLTSLHWQQADVDQEALAHLSEMPQLTSLSLAINEAGIEALPSIVQMSELKQLGLSFNLAANRPITQQEFSQLTALKQLESLTLTSILLEKGCLQAVSLWPELSNLNLTNTVIDDAEFANLGRLPKLRMLYLGNTKVTQGAVDAFNRLNPQCQVYR